MFTQGFSEELERPDDFHAVQGGAGEAAEKTLRARKLAAPVSEGRP
jgi:hypothetical protein